MTDERTTRDRVLAGEQCTADDPEPAREDARTSAGRDLVRLDGVGDPARAVREIAP